MHPSRTRILVLVLGAALALAGCTSTPKPSPPSASPSVPAPYDGPDAPPLEPAEVWTTDTETIDLVGDADLVGSSLVVTGLGNKTLHHNDSVVIDQRLGSVRWRASQLPREFALDSEPGAVARLSHFSGWPIESGPDGILVLPYHLGPCQDGGHSCSKEELKPYGERGLVAFSLADRSQVWHTKPIRVPDDEDGVSQRRFRVAGASEHVVLASFAADEYWRDPVSDDDRAPLTIGYGVQTGEELWRRPGLVAEAIVDGVGIGQEPSSRPRVEGGVPVGIDLTTGRELWSMPTETSAVWSSIGAGHAIVVDYGRSSSNVTKLRLLRGRNGEVIDLPTSAPDAIGWIASPIAGGPLAWRVVSEFDPDGSRDGDKLYSLDADGSVRVGVTNPRDGAGPRATGFGPYVWLNLPDGRIQAFDQTGAARSEVLTGRVHALGSDLLLISQPRSTSLRLLRV